MKKQTESSDAVSKFQKLFWDVHKVHVKKGKNASPDDVEHQRALAHARKHGFGWAEVLLEASLLQSQGKCEEALKLLVKQQPEIPTEVRFLSWFIQGAALKKLNHFGEAINAYHKALDDPNNNKLYMTWLVLGNIYNDKGEYDEAIKAYRKALDDPNNNEPYLAMSNLGNAYLYKKDYDEAIKAYRKALDDPKNDESYIAMSNMGNAYIYKNEYDEAIKAHREALDDPKNDEPYIALHNLGHAYQYIGNYDEAIKAYREALDDPNNYKPYKSWYNLGNIYNDKGEYDEAIKAYRKALDDPNNKDPYKAWHNLGNTYHNKGEYDEAIKAYRKALDDPNYNMPAMTLVNMANVYRSAGRKNDARKALETVLNKPDSEGTQHLQARSLLSLLDAELKPGAMSADDRAQFERSSLMREELTPEQRILLKIQTTEQSQYDSYLENAGSNRDNVLSILRGWSSAVTLLEGSERLWRGGGYFLKWRGKGIVIDPGFEFLRNFHDAGYHGREIDAVLVSHNHSDHNADLKKIDDLQYELYKRRKKDPHGEINPYVLVWDADTQDAVKFSVEEPEHQFRPILFDIGRCNPCDNIRQPHGLPFSLTYFPVRHGPELHSAVGFKLSLEDDGQTVFTVGYTGDTEFFPELVNHLEGCDMLLAHISQPDSSEFLDSKVLKKNHLGYRGLAELIKHSKPKLTLVGEFWAGLADLRIDLVQGLRRLALTEAILPAGIGMHLHLPEMEVECTECGKKTICKDVRVAPPADRFTNLAYLCPRCILT